MSSPLRDLRDVKHRDITDDRLFAEIRAVLERHDAVDRFGLVLLHKHFDLMPGERLVEVVDVRERTLTIKPMSAFSPRAVTAIETQWRLDAPTPTLGCDQWCYEDPADGSHLSAHAPDDDEDDD